MKNNKGVTLLALCITIGILVVISVVVAYIALDNDNLFANIKRGVENHKLAATEEDLNLEANETSANNNGKVYLNDYLEHLKAEGIISDGDIEEITVGKEAEIVVDEYIFRIIQVDEGVIEIDYVGIIDAERFRIISMDLTSTTKTITVDVNACGNTGGKYIYYYKQNIEDNYIRAAETKNDTYTIGGLTQGQKYYIKVEICKKNRAAYAEGERETTEIEALNETNASFDVPVWENGKAQVTARTSVTGYTLQVSKDSINWTPQEEDLQAVERTITDISNNDTVYARLWDGVNGSPYLSTTIVDTIKPKTAMISIDEKTSQASVEQIDEESGIDITSCKWVYNSEEEEVGLEPRKYTGGTFYSNDSSVPLDISEDTKYLHVLTVDNADNKLETVTEVASYVAQANKPKLSTGMIPIKFNGTNWVVCSSTDKNWYSYEKEIGTTDSGYSKWANVMLSDGRYKDTGNGIVDSKNNNSKVNPGQVILENDLGSMFVWIPRYAYRINCGFHTCFAKYIEIEFLQGTSTQSSVSGREFINKTGYGNWNIHPAFNFGGKEIEGIWVAKFEASNPNCTKDYRTGEVLYNKLEKAQNDVVKVLPNKTSWRRISVSNAFTSCLNMSSKYSNVYGISNNTDVIDPHLMKNVDWGAVAYLTQSCYGRNKHELFLNNSNSYITGNSSGEISPLNIVDMIKYTYKTLFGAKASTTGNVYGIYDLSGGALEYVAAYVSNSYTSSKGARNSVDYALALISGSDKYKDVYTGQVDSQVWIYKNNSNKYGDAIYETSSTYIDNNSWFEDYSYGSYSSSPIFVRGGYCGDGIKAGIFRFSGGYGCAYTFCSFRPTIVVY